MEKRMKTVLFLPFLQISSRHDQTAILSFSYGKIEKIISHIYLKWIHLFPRLYNSIYINSGYNNREKNKRYRLYEWLFMSFMMKIIKANAILTKPGGVTNSESLFKRKPIFIYDALPGQEEINLKYLKEAGLVFHLNKGNICEQILSILQDKDGINRYQLQVANFHSQIYSKEPSEIITNILMD
ncbi:hypothetical protein [Cytobacillus massiliigabonensis]|uniref:hypothetical protein n=1 Tax=Cytobacillus massiliigabonensis TaxID=1871011 RepID=UPI000C834CE0|nr:hypothetical protein [Cytobacillus massiliigabonensis]